MKESSKKLLEVKDLKTILYLDEGELKAVDGVSFSIGRGKTLGLVGESGCGKSMAVQSILRIEPKFSKIFGNVFLYNEDGKRMDLVKIKSNSSSMLNIRGGRISMIFQEPMAAFSALHSIGNQIIEAVLIHRTNDKKIAKEIVIESLQKVGISNPKQRYNEYPHHFSGGMRQRALIAMALACQPELLIADEPTTALDVTVQAQVLSLMRSLQQEFGMAILYISHDLGVIANMVDEVVVMYLGKVVEHTTTDKLFYNPLHPYTKALLESIPRIGKKTKKRLFAIKGNVPIPINKPIGCDFYDRCSMAIKNVCNQKNPKLISVKNNHSVSCFIYDN